MSLVRLVEEKILQVVEKVFDVLDGNMDFDTYQGLLKKDLDGLGLNLLKIVLEALEEKIEEDRDQNSEWKRVRKNDPKTILTIFGNLTYHRSYYRHKNSKKYEYLVDKQIGVTPHSRVGTVLKGELAEASAGMSYEKASVHISRFNPELKVSKQTVSSVVKDFRPPKGLVPPEKKRVNILYIEADEDHVKVRGCKGACKGAQVKLIYVHEGIEDIPRRHLKNAKYFTSSKKEPEELWFEVLDYLEENYDLSYVKRIFLSGDGAPWIQLGKEYIPGAIYILDKFHLAKYILMATAHLPELKRQIYQGIKALDKGKVQDCLYKALGCAEGEPRQKRILNTIKYIDHNWDGITNAVKNPHVGCSAEGHVSHILSARLSSRPMAWSPQGVENMANMRVTEANGGKISKQYLEIKKSPTIVVDIRKAMQKEVKRLRNTFSGKENLNNIPLYCGGNNYSRIALKGLNGQTAI